MAEQHHHSPSSFLLCQEKQHNFEEEEEEEDSRLIKPPFLPSILPSDEEHDDLLFLISKERGTHFYSSTLTLLEGTRHHGVCWITRVSTHYGFTALTTVLAVNYFDRFITSLMFQRDKPWMTQLTAVACVSLAAKMEETQVPLLLDLQVEESKFVFEAKTIQRMELLVLSTLQWNMNPVTPISFFQYIAKRLGVKSCFHWEFLCRCEQVLLCVIADSRVMRYVPSTLAAAIMIHVIKEIGPFNALEYKNQLLGLVKVSEEQVNECYKLMLKLIACCEGIHNVHQKRKRLSEPSSPGGVIDASFSYDSTNEPVLKRSKTQDQQIQLPLVNRESSDVLDNPT